MVDYLRGHVEDKGGGLDLEDVFGEVDVGDHHGGGDVLEGSASDEEGEHVVCQTVGHVGGDLGVPDFRAGLGVFHDLEGEGLGGIVTAEQVKAYIEALSAVFNMIDKEYSDRLLATLKSPTLEVLAICLEDMTAKSMQLDQLVGKTFMLKPLEKTMASIIAFKQHTDGQGRYSGLRIVQAMCAATTKLTGARLGDLLKSVFKPLTDVPGEIHQLEPAYKKHSESLTALESLDIEEAMS